MSWIEWNWKIIQIVIDCTYCTRFKNLNIVNTSIHPQFIFSKPIVILSGKFTFSIATVHGLGRSNSLIVMIRPFPLVSPLPPLMTTTTRGVVGRKRRRDSFALILTNNRTTTTKIHLGIAQDQLTKEEAKVERKNWIKYFSFFCHGWFERGTEGKNPGWTVRNGEYHRTIMKFNWYSKGELRAWSGHKYVHTHKLIKMLELLLTSIFFCSSILVFLPPRKRARRNKSKFVAAIHNLRLAPVLSGALSPWGYF